MKKSELKLLIKECVKEVYSEQRQRIDEVMLKNLAEKVLAWLFTKLKKASPETFEKISNAIKEKDKKELEKTFNDPRVKDQEKLINESVLTESPIEKLRQIINWIKENKTSISIYAILGIISTVIGVIHDGGVANFLVDIGPKIIGTAAAGAVGGFGFGFGGDFISQIKGTGSVKDVKWKDALLAGVDASKKGFVAGLLAGPLSGVASTLFSQFGVGAAGAKIIGATAGGAASRIPDLIQYIQNLPSGKKLIVMLHSRKDDRPHLKDKKQDIENWYNWALFDRKDGLETEDLDHHDVKVALDKLLRNTITSEEFSALKNFLDKQHGISFGKA